MFFTVEKIEKLLKEVRESIYRDRVEISRFKYTESPWPGDEPGAERPDFDDRQWLDFSIHEAWGGYDKVAWFRTAVSIPEEWQQKKLALRFQVGPRDGGGSTAETLLFVNGVPLQGIDVWHEDAWLPPEFIQGGRIFVALKAWSGVLDTPHQRRFQLAELVLIDEAAERFYYLGNTLIQSIRQLDENDLRRVKLLNLLNQAMQCVDFMRPCSEAYYQSLLDAGQFLAAGLEQLQTREIKPKVTGVGHSHIDMAWLWRLAHTREKAARTFSTVLNLMRQYPEYHFMHSSPQLYQFLKEDYPRIYQQVKQKIRERKWEVTGGMWVEADTNLTSGESLIRQFLFGRRFMRREFGVETNVLWLPDVFGYSAALPQIIRKSGVKYFLTSKISWSQFNRFPYDTFRWRGLDGSEVLTHFVTTPEDNSWFYTYNGQTTAKDVKGIWTNYRQKDVNDELLLLYGWGDGGGGPTKEMIESARALKNIPGMPEVELGHAEPYFSRLAQRLEGEDLPVWDGELYLEYHRGAYTSQAAIKRANRFSEILFHNAEWMSAIADIVLGQQDYPSQELEKGWELILLNQFHDILPGSSIGPVYVDALLDYQQVTEIGEKALGRAKSALSGAISTEQESLVVFNPTSWMRSGLVELPWSEGLAGKTILNAAGCPSLTQEVVRNGECKLLLSVSDVPSLGYRSFPFVRYPGARSSLPNWMASLTQQGQNYVEDGNRVEVGTRLSNGTRVGSDSARQPVAINLKERNALKKEKAVFVGIRSKGFQAYRHVFVHPGANSLQNQMSIRHDRLENRFYRIELNENGQITSLWDKRVGREVLPKGARANVLQAFEDKPMAFDAWDIDIYYQEKMSEVSELVGAIVEEAGPLRGVLRLQWRFGDSRVTQHMTIYQDSPRIDFLTEVDWKEKQVLLKAAFPVNIRATRATYDIQFGSIERPTHWNTSWDYARFEVPGHKWVDLSEGNYGVSLLNDCKYGHDVKNNVMRLTLIKSAVRPDPLADKGKHSFTYSLLPHAGDWRQADVVQEAYALNYPLLFEHIPARQDGPLPGSSQFASLDVKNVLLETVKKAEVGEAWIVRVYEYQQSRSESVSLRFGQVIRKAVEVNLVEEEERPVDYSGNHINFPIDPFEIKTFKVWF